MPKSSAPAKPSPVILALRREAQRTGTTAYAIAQALTTAQGKRWHARTVQRLLDGEVSPSLATLEAVAGALGFHVGIARRHK